MEQIHERLERLTHERGLDEAVLSIAVRISKEDARHARRRLALLAELKDLGYDEDDISGDPGPKFEFSEIKIVVEAAPDEQAMLQAVMVRIQERGNYDPLIAELAIATLGPHDIDDLVEFLDSLDIQTPTHSKSADGQVLVECVACEDQLAPKDLILATCGHCYCGTCLDMVFNAAVLDESLYPPRCCANTPISLKNAKRFLEAELVKTVEEKGIEFSTVDRTYCSNPACSTFIPLSDIHGDAAVCGNCERQTCVVCKAPAHGGDCPADETLKTLLAHAEKMRWQRCYNCLRIVQRQDGCNHIDCRCGAGFCYNCGRPSRDEAPCSCLLENRRQHPNRTYDPTTGEEIMHNYRLYRRPEDGSRPPVPERGPEEEMFLEEDENGWPVDMDQAERRRIEDAHVQRQALFVHEWRHGPADGYGWRQDPVPAPAPAQGFEAPPFDVAWPDTSPPQSPVIQPDLPNNQDVNFPVYHDPEPDWEIARPDFLDMERRENPDLSLADDQWPTVANYNQHLHDDPDGEMTDPELDAPATPPSAPTAETDGPWNLTNDPTVCLHLEWWNHQGTATCSVCETDSRRTVCCEECNMQVCRRCRDEGRVPYGVIHLPWTGGEVVEGGVNPDVRW